MIEIEVQVNDGNAVEIDGNEANVFIFGDLGSWFGFGEMDLIRVLKNRDLSRVNVYINSLGGSLVTGVTIHDLLKGSDVEVVAYLVGQCASAATVAACGADRVIMSRNCLYLVHRPMLDGYIQANRSEDLRKSADYLDSWEAILIDMYRRKTELEAEAIRDLIGEDTWLEPETALALGFVDELADSVTIDWTLPSEGGETFEYMTTAWNKYADGEVMNGRQAYSSAVLDLVNKKFSSKAAPVTDAADNQNSEQMSLINQIVNALTGGGVINEDQRDAAVQALTGEELALDAFAQAVANRLATRNNAEGEEDGEATTVTVENPLTGDALLELVEGLSEEDRQRLGQLIQVQVEEDEEEADETVSELTEQIEALQNSVADLSTRLAATSTAGTKRRKGTNGASDITSSDGSEGGNKPKVRNSQLIYLLNAYDNNQITDKVFVKTAGMDVEAARQQVA
jgi:ATP-dependent protease ClpP protease subunit